MANPLDMALDDVVNLNKRNKRGTPQNRRPSGQRRNFVRRPIPQNDRVRSPRRPLSRTNNNNISFRRNRTNRIDDNKQWEHDMYEEEETLEQFSRPQRRNQVNPQIGTRVNISNLHYTVSEEDLRELFSAVGDVKYAKIRFDKSGRSEGEGFVILLRKADALSAIQRYNGVALDGKNMKISLAPSLDHQRRGQLSPGNRGPRFSSIRSGNGGGGFQGNRRLSLPRSSGRRENFSFRARLPTRGGRFNNRGGRRSSSGSGLNQTMDELNADLDRYNNEQ